MSDTVALSGPRGPIRPGLMIAGKYRLEQEIGRGSMGVVYRALHVTLGQRVAIKLISGEHLQSAEMRHRFSVEAKTAAKLRSRHVVQVIDDGETPEGNPYIVLELLEGETLEERLAREHDVPLADAVRIVTHVGRALARAHAQGIVHRDLKPGNVFLVKSDDDDAGWVAKVLDFGIAKLAQETGTTKAGTVLGTPVFMSPEQVRGASSVDHRADLYSLGMCLFHMLTGEYAHYSASYSEILVGICTRPLPLLRERAPWLPLAMELWFQRACAKLPIDRFQSADEMTEALQAAAGGGSPRSKHESVPEGRIAPETLVGFAAPPLTTVQLQASELGFALAPSALQGGAPVTPHAVEVARERAIGTGAEWLPKRRSSRFWVTTLGLGLLALLSLVVTLRLLSRREPATASPANGKSSPSSTSSFTPLTPAGQEPRSAEPPPPALSSATAEAPPAANASGRRTHPKMTPSRAAAAPRSSVAVPPRPRAAEDPKTSSSDLGF